MQQKLVQILFTSKSWGFWKQHRKRTVKATLKTGKYVYYVFTENIYSAHNPMQFAVFSKHLLTSYNNDSKSSYFEGSIIH